MRAYKIVNAVPVEITEEEFYSVLSEENETMKARISQNLVKSELFLKLADTSQGKDSGLKVCAIATGLTLLEARQLARQFNLSFALSSRENDDRVWTYEEAWAELGEVET